MRPPFVRKSALLFFCSAESREIFYIGYMVSERTYMHTHMVEGVLIFAQREREKEMGFSHSFAFLNILQHK
jgi:hypothetical protein